MSYILEALKKSEKKRQRNSVPDLHTVHAPGTEEEGPRKRSYRPVFVAGAALVAGIGVATVFFSFQNQGAETAPQARKSVQVETAPPAERGAVPVLTPAVPPGKAEIQPAPVPKPTAQPTRQVAESLPDTVTVSKKMKEVVREETVVTHQPEPVARKLRKESADIQPRPAPLATDSDVPAPASTSGVPIEASEHLARREPQKELAPAPLSWSGKATLPDLTISFHLYADEPASRMVSINGRVLREGEEVSDGLLLEEITSEGIILNLKGERFSKKVF